MLKLIKLFIKAQNYLQEHEVLHRYALLNVLSKFT